MSASLTCFVSNIHVNMLLSLINFQNKKIDNEFYTLTASFTRISHAFATAVNDCQSSSGTHLFFARAAC